MSILDRLRQRSGESDPMQAATVMTVAQLRERNRKFVIFMQHKVQALEAAVADYQQHETEMAPADEEDCSWAEPVEEAEPEIKQEENLWPKVEAMTFEAAPPDEGDDLSWVRPAAPAGEVEEAEPAKMEDWMSLMGVTNSTDTRFEAAQAETVMTQKVEVEQDEALPLPDFTGPEATAEEFSVAKQVGLSAKTGGEITPAPGDAVESVGFGGIQDFLIRPEAE